MRALLAMGMIAIAGSASAAPAVHAHDLTLTGAVMRATPPGVSTTGGYLTIANAGAKSDRLVSVSCTCASMVMLHATVMHMGMATMTDPGFIAIPAHGQAQLTPGGYHLMLMGLKAPPKDGSTQAMTLRFEHAGAVVVPFAVNARIQAEPARPAMPAMPGMAMPH